MSQDYARFEEIMWQIKSLAEEAIDILSDNGLESEVARAKSYWYPHIKGAIDRDHPYLGGSMVRMDDSLAALEESEYEGLCMECRGPNDDAEDSEICTGCRSQIESAHNRR